MLPSDKIVKPGLLEAAEVGRETTGVFSLLFYNHPVASVHLKNTEQQRACVTADGDAIRECSRYLPLHSDSRCEAKYIESHTAN